MTYKWYLCVKIYIQNLCDINFWSNNKRFRKKIEKMTSQNYCDVHVENKIQMYILLISHFLVIIKLILKTFFIYFINYIFKSLIYFIIYIIKYIPKFQIQCCWQKVGTLFREFWYGILMKFRVKLNYHLTFNNYINFYVMSNFILILITCVCIRHNFLHMYDIRQHL